MPGRLRRRILPTCIVALLGICAAQPSVAGAEVLTAGPGAAIAVTVPNAKGSPYPGSINVFGANGHALDVNVKVTLSHTWPDDLDLVLESPLEETVVLISDACGSGDLAGTTFTFNEQAASSLADGGPCSTGTFKPTNINDGTDTWETPGPGSPTSTSLGNFSGDPNGTWRLFVVDDVPGEDGGTISSWSLEITTDESELVIPGAGTVGTASQYPLTKTFDTPPGKVVSDVNYEAFDFHHTFPDDVDMLLAGPRRGATTLLMSDACGSSNPLGITWLFDDEAAASLGDNAGADCNVEERRPSNFEEEADTFPAPAPGGPYGTSLSVFDGLEGGQWQLFAVDDASLDSGFIAGLELVVTTRDAADTGFTVGSVRVEEGGNASLEVKRTGPTDLGPATLNVSTEGTAKAGADFTAPAGTLEFARGEASKTIEVPIANDKVGEPTEKLKLVLASPRDDARLTGTTSAEVTIGPDNEIKFGKLKKNAKKGTAKLFLTLPGPGKIITRSKQVKRVKKTFKKGGKAAILLKPKGKALGQLLDEGSAKVALKITFTPVDGSALTSTRKAKLILND
jgi:subtilisin-like proprotein convertase family protein